MKIIGADTKSFLNLKDNKFLKEYFTEIDKDFKEIGLTSNYIALTERKIEKDTLVFLCFYIVEVPDEIEAGVVPQILEDHFEQLHNCNVLIQFSSCTPMQIAELTENPEMSSRVRLFKLLFEGEE